MKIRTTGISIQVGPVGVGYSWETLPKPVDRIKELFTFLESKRLLTNPIEMEVVEQCKESALEIKNRLCGITQGICFEPDDTDSINTMIDSCNTFLDALNMADTPHLIYKTGGNWANMPFDTAMKKFRFVFKNSISMLEKRHLLKFRKEIPDKW